MNKKLNGYAKWIIIIIAVGTILYNTVVTHTIVRNDVKHLQQDVAEVKQAVQYIERCLIGRKK